MYKWLGFIIFALTGFDAFASVKPNLLSATPEICVTSEEDKVCRFQFTIKLEFNDFSNFCVEVENPNYKQCYTETKLLNQKITLNLLESTYLFVKDPEDEVLAAQLLTIARIKKKKARPRRNLGWILF